MNRTETKPAAGDLAVIRRIKKAPEEPVAPEKQKLSSSSSLSSLLTASGYALRALVALVSVFSLSMFISDSFKTIEAGGIGGWKVLLVSFVAVAFFSVMALNRVTLLAGLGALALGAGAFFLFVREPVKVIVNSALCLWNQIMNRLLTAGYRAFETVEYDNELAEGYVIENERLLNIALVGMIVVLAAIYVFALVKKTRLSIALGLGLIIAAGVFTYNVARNNWWFAMMLAAMGGMLALKLYDKHYAPAEEDQAVTDLAGKETAASKKARRSGITKRQALGGFAGGTAMLLVFIAAAAPAATIKHRWDYYEFIDRKLTYFNAVTSSFIVGEVPNQGDLGYLGNLDTLNARDVETELHVFTGQEMLKVQTSYPFPMYLRSWVGTYFQEDKWYSATTEDVERYRGRFGPDFVPEQIMKNFYGTLSTYLMRVNSLSSYYDHVDDGFTTVSVDMKNVSSSGNLLFIPTFFDPASGLMKYGTTEFEPYEENYKNYYEGIYTTGWLNINKQYRVSAYVPTYRSPEFEKHLADQLEDYSRIIELIRMYDSGVISGYPEPEPQMTVAEENGEITMTDALESGTLPVAYDTVHRAFDAYTAMTREEQKQFLYNNVTLAEDYEDFVRSVYLGYPRLDALNKAAFGIIDILKEKYPEVMAEVETSEGVFDVGILYDRIPYETIRTVIDWLSGNFTYTLTPVASRYKNRDAITTFLNETHEGYCVQFATAAALLLRELGVPTRYCEGYIVDSFDRNDLSASNAEYNEKNEIVNRYSSSVRDWDAHAWIECYLPGRGWMQFETTPEYYDSMYKLYEQTTTSYSSSAGHMSEPVTETSEEDDDDDEPVKKIDYSAYIKTGAIALAAAAAVIAVIVTLVRLKKKSDDNDFRRTSDISESRLDGLSDDDIRKLGYNLSQDILDA
ncbi:MAG: transglutaminase-like domain-containing protein, partial [Clostridiales bacterium]|nr:transglutaminase-like domain-containing protein [Clostridiales bacterium]